MEIFLTCLCTFLFSQFTYIKWSVRSVLRCLIVQKFNSSGDSTHHKVASWVPGMCRQLAYGAQAGRGTRVSSCTGRGVIGLQLLNEISSWDSAVHLLSAGTDWGFWTASCKHFMKQIAVNQTDVGKQLECLNWTLHCLPSFRHQLLFYKDPLVNA